MAAVTTNTSPRALSHQTLAPGKLTPAAGLIHDARHAHFCSRRSNPPAQQHDESRPGFRLSTCAITCTHPASTTVP
jgi:hypothetical protein